jgi:hypothetical protein
MIEEGYALSRYDPDHRLADSSSNVGCVVSLSRRGQGRQAGEHRSPNAIMKEKAAEIAADFMTTFYGVQVGALETEEFEASDGISDGGI